MAISSVCFRGTAFPVSPSNVTTNNKNTRFNFFSFYLFILFVELVAGQIMHVLYLLGVVFFFPSYLLIFLCIHFCVFEEFG